ncbi:hypothetical protein BH11ARM2_BH11ARM2_28040 [soil metagenome]
MDPRIEEAKTQFLQAKEAFFKAFAAVPDERLNWSPSATSRTPIQQVAHAAESIGHIHAMLNGHPFPVPTTTEADKGFRENDARFTTREEVLDLIERNSGAYIAWLDNVAPERLDDTATLPFGLGQAPVSAVLSAPADHTRWHLAQLDYMQTIYGDQDWRF